MADGKFEIIGAATTRDMNEKLADIKIVKVITCSSHIGRDGVPAIICLIEKKNEEVKG